jgi:O-antigen ligase
MKEFSRKAILVLLFALPFVPLLVSASLFFPFITTKVFAFRFIVEAAFFLWIALALISPEFRPKRSPILYALIAFLVVIGLADIFGAAPLKSFWSNYERMEGYITLLHLGALFLVMSSVFKEREWRWWWNTSIAASALMIVYCLFQLAGVTQIHQGGARIDGTLGNAAYLALYFLIHIFITLFYYFRSRGSVRWTYAAVTLGQAYMLYLTATRGAILALLGGLALFALISAVSREKTRLRLWSRALLALIVVLVLGFVALRNSSFVKKSPVLERLSTVNLSQWKNEGRSFVWPMALQGIKEKPILGWGQDNFNYIFAEHYSPEMFRLEPWFDRAHNIFLDWAVAGGILGLGSYLSLYVVLLILIWKSLSFTRTDKAVLTGLLAAYFFNNIFVFDNIVSYMLFIALLAQVHSQEAWRNKEEAKPVEEGRALSLFLPLALVFVFVLYFFNIKPMVANTSLIKALQSAQSPAGSREPAIGYFERAYNESRLGRPEVVEWLSSSAANILSDNSISESQRDAYFTFVQKAVEDMTQTLPNDPRYELVAGNLYASVGLYDQALAHYNRAKALMPEKQMIYFYIGQILYYKKDYAGSIAALKYAYYLAPEYEDAKNIYESALQQIPH